MFAHYTRPITDQQGDLLPNAQVTVYDPDTTNPITEVLYSDDLGTVLTNPFVSSTGIIDIYTAIPMRVRLGIIQGDLPVQYYENVDILAAGVDGQHLGAGSNSLVLGPSATAVGNNSVALGQGANSPGASGTAVGATASAAGPQSLALGSAAAQGIAATAVGYGTQASGTDGTAVGSGALATNNQSTALGYGATASFTNSTAIGAGAVTTANNQVMLGSTTAAAEIPVGQSLVMTSPGGFRYGITVDDTGALVTTAM